MADGKNVFLMEECRVLTLFCLLIEFLWGVVDLCAMRGYVGMKVAVDSSSPTSQSAETQPANAFIEAFRGLLKLFALINLYSRWYL